MSQEQLVCRVVRGLQADEVRAACRALALSGDARTRALRDHRAGDRLLAALELGRRACLAPTQVRRRLRGPADAAALMRPLLAGVTPSPSSSAPSSVHVLALLSLDVRMRVVAADVLAPSTPGVVLRRTLSLGANRALVGRVTAGPAVPRSDDVDAALELLRAARLVDCCLVDWIILGDDGTASLARLGLLEPGDARYR